MQQDHDKEYLVIKSTGSWYNLLDKINNTTIKARLKGNLRLKGSRATNPVVVGDRVLIDGDINRDEAVIKTILPRKNYIIRKSNNLSRESHIIAANIDTVYIVCTLSEPPTAPEFIDRILVTAQLYNIPAVILINKCDIEAQDYLSPIYNLAKIEIIKISATKLIGIEQLKQQIKTKTVLFTGNSGVGKSTLINAIDSTLKAKTGEMSIYHNRGRHTTTFSEIFPFGNGFIIDTPGVKGFGLVEVQDKELHRYFVDMMRFSPECTFSNCTHTHEPKCAVRSAVENGDIHNSRYESYLKMLQQDDAKYR